MIGAVGQGDLAVEQRITGQHAFDDTGFETLLDRRPEFARHVATGDLGFKQKAAAGFARLDGVFNLGVLTRAAGLLLVGVGILHTLGDGFAVGHLRLANHDFHAMGTTQNVDLDVEVQFAHALQNALAGLLVGFDVEGRVFGNHLAERDAHLLRAGLVLRRDRDRDHGSRKDHRFQGGGIFGIAQGMAGLHVLHTEHRDNVAGLG